MPLNNTKYMEVYLQLRDAVISHRMKKEYNDRIKRDELADIFYRAEGLTSNIEEKELYEYLCGCADLISDSAELDGQDYVDFLKDIILTFNNVLPPDLAKTIPENVF